MPISAPLTLHMGRDLNAPPPAPVKPVVKPGDVLPDPVFPRRPQLLTTDPWPGDGERHWSRGQILHAMRGWAFPYVKSRIYPGDFHPIVAYLFTEYKCNIDCHYCYSYNNTV